MCYNTLLPNRRQIVRAKKLSSFWKLLNGEEAFFCVLWWLLKSCTSLAALLFHPPELQEPCWCSHVCPLPALLMASFALFPPLLTSGFSFPLGSLAPPWNPVLISSPALQQHLSFSNFYLCLKCFSRSLVTSDHLRSRSLSHYLIQKSIYRAFSRCFPCAKLLHVWHSLVSSAGLQIFLEVPLLPGVTP